MDFAAKLRDRRESLNNQDGPRNPNERRTFKCDGPVKQQDARPHRILISLVERVEPSLKFVGYLDRPHATIIAFGLYKSKRIKLS
jgi:hypothetical protein